jgi:hypothetical protein
MKAIHRASIAGAHAYLPKGMSDAEMLEVFSCPARHPGDGFAAWESVYWGVFVGNRSGGGFRVRFRG